MRVVIDTNVIVSALFFGGVPREVLDHVEVGSIVPCFTRDTLDELAAMLVHPKFDRERAR